MSDRNPFNEPMTDTEILRSVWVDMQTVKDQVKTTNGRVSRLERFQWMIIGGLTVLALVIVPQWIEMAGQ